MSDIFSVSVKGVLKAKGKYLLRFNERNEWELLGGKLERADRSLKSRLVQEFKEESGIKIKATNHLEPWLYEIGEKSVIILPFACEAVKTPKKLTDADGGRLGWFSLKELANLNLPDGYLHTIKGIRPEKSFSYLSGGELKYLDDGFEVFVKLKDIQGKVWKQRLEGHVSPRDLAHRILSSEYLSGFKLVSVPPTRRKSKLFLNYFVDR